MQQSAPASATSTTTASEDGSVLLTAEGLSQTYDGDTFQFRDVGLTVARGAKLGLVGDNGCGKSTLLKVGADTSPPPEAPLPGVYERPRPTFSF
jgi:ATPase subunit of ABC transporter with duplicated ATPase domains